MVPPNFYKEWINDSNYLQSFSQRSSFNSNQNISETTARIGLTTLAGLGGMLVGAQMHSIGSNIDAMRLLSECKNMTYNMNQLQQESEEEIPPLSALTLLEIAQCSVILKENPDQSPRRILAKLKRDNQPQLIEPLKASVNEGKQTLNIIEQKLSEFLLKIKEAKQQLEIIMGQVKNPDMRHWTDHDVEKKLTNLQKAKAQLQSEHEQLTLEIRPIEALLQTSNAALQKELMCPYTKKPLVEAILVKTEQSTLCMNASYLGLKREGTELIKIPAELSEEAKKIKEQMIFYRPDYSIYNLAMLVFEDKSEQISLEHELLQDTVFLDIFKDPQNLQCGHTFNRSSIEKLHIPNCPLCREPIHDQEAIDHPLLENLIEVMRDHFKEILNPKEAIKEKQESLKSLSSQIASLQQSIDDIQQIVPFLPEIRQLKNDIFGWNMEKGKLYNARIESIDQLQKQENELAEYILTQNKLEVINKEAEAIVKAYEEQYFDDIYGEQDSDNRHDKQNLDALAIIEATKTKLLSIQQPQAQLPKTALLASSIALNILNRR